MTDPKSQSAVQREQETGRWLVQQIGMLPDLSDKYARGIWDRIVEVVARLREVEQERDAAKQHAMIDSLRNRYVQPPIDPTRRRLLNVRCGTCDLPIYDEEEHNCPLKDKLDKLEHELVGAFMTVDFCDHFCCGLPPMACHAKALAYWIRNQSELLTEVSAAEARLAQAGKLAESARKLADVAQRNLCREALFHVPCEYGIEGGCQACIDMLALRTALSDFDKL